MSDTLAPQQPQLHNRSATWPLQFLYAPVLMAVAGGCVWGMYRGLMIDQPRTLLASALLLGVLVGISVAHYRLGSAYLPAHWTGVSLAAFVISALNFELGFWPFDPWYDGVPYFIGGVAALGLAIRADTFPPVPKWGATAAQPPLRITWACAVPGLIGLFLVAETSGQTLGFTALEWPLHAQFALILVAYFLLWCGVGGITWADVRSLQSMRITTTGIALLIITVMGLLLRTWELETAIHQFVDEMNFGRAVWNISQPDAVSVGLLEPFSGVAAFPYIYPYWQQIGIEVFGWNLTALRAISVVFGTLTIPATYLLVKALLDDTKLALIAALLLATFPAHIHFSRLGINNIADPLIGVLMLYFLIKGVRYQKQYDFAAAGIMLGLTQYFYEGGRIVYPLLALAWTLSMVMLWRTRMNRATLRRFGVFIGLGVLVAMPIYYTLIAVDRPIFARFETAGVGGSYWQTMQEYDREQTLEDHILRPLLIYVRNPDLSEFYGGEEAMLLVFMVPFFLAGVAYGVWRLRYPPTMLLLGWVAAVSVGGMFLAESGHTARFVVVFPALMAVVTLGLWYISLRHKAVVILVAAVLAILQADYYFNTHLDVYNIQRRQFPDYQDALFRVADLPADSEACFVTPDPMDTTTIRNIRDFISPDIQICYLGPDELTIDYLDATQTRDTVLAFMVRPEDDESMALLERFYADNIEGPLLSPYETVREPAQYRIYVFRP